MESDTFWGRSSVARDTGRAMSQENVELVRRAIDALNDGDIDRAVTHADPEGELHSAIIGGAEGNVYRGHEGLRQWYAEVMESFTELRTELTELDAVTGWVFTVRRGKLLRAEGYLSRDDALAAAGLRE
jgi:hypothetical protein